MERAIGGYPPLELNCEGALPFPDALPINLGRTGLELIMRHRHYRQVRVPAYCCPVVFETLQRCGVRYETYQLGPNFEPIADPSSPDHRAADPLRDLAPDEAILYVNYFGVKNGGMTRLAERFGTRLIADLTPAFFQRPPGDCDGFSSARKFLGVPDGGFLFGSGVTAWGESLPRQSATGLCGSLLMRAEDPDDTSPGYVAFQAQESAMKHFPLARMSHLTEKILRSVSFPTIAERRRRHFRILHERLGTMNTLAISFDPGLLADAPDHGDGRTIGTDAVPQYYPLLPAGNGVGAKWKKRLCEERIFVPTLWPGLESPLTANLVCLPVSQHLTETDLERIIKNVKNLK